METTDSKTKVALRVIGYGLAGTAIGLVAGYLFLPYINFSYDSMGLMTFLNMGVVILEAGILGLIGGVCTALAGIRRAVGIVAGGVIGLIVVHILTGEPQFYGILAGVSLGLWLGSKPKLKVTAQ